MSIVSWNCRGIGDPKKDLAIKNLIFSQKCILLGLVETKHKELQPFKLRSWWGHSEIGWEHAPAIERGGGVIVCWDTNKFERHGSQNGSRWVIIQGLLKEWMLKCDILIVYAPNTRVERKQLWEELVTIRTDSSHPLLVMGDFNEVRQLEERNGGSNCNGSIREFLRWSDDMALEDVPLLGRKFTWARGKSRSRLDRAFIDISWGCRFPDLTLRALPNTVSDHAPIALALSKQVPESKPFRSMDVWFSHPGYTKMIKEQWESLGNIPIYRKLKALHQPVRRWNKLVFGNIDTNIKRFEEEQLRMQMKIDNGNGDDCDLARLAAIESQLNLWLDRKAAYWKQLARDRWIKSGDRNTKYYHAVALGKRRFKRIDQIRNGHRMCKKPREIKMAVLKFFKNLYKQKLAPSIHLDDRLLPKISSEHVAILERRPSLEEINRALDDCDVTKAPGYDGFNFRFIKELWQNIGHEICELVYEFFDSGSLPREINRTWVTLIPKVEGAVDVKDFRPISLIGCLYKLIAKILAKRLSSVLPILIGETQCAFVKNRQILDGALIANEVVWWFKKTKQKAAILKLDFQKAYDTVRWDFLEETMRGMGFGCKWIKWIMECVSTASMSILINGSPTSPFHLQRGLRQGDPLSPLLFLLIAETFNRLVLRGRELGILDGVRVGSNHILVTHLQFADDTVIFSPADANIIDNYKKFLQCFAVMSGLRINYQKSALIPLGRDEEWIQQALRSLKCSLAKLPITYLGIPLGANPRKTQMWKPILDKVEKRLAMWKARSLSKAGRLVLIKSVLNNLPMYYLSLFRMPKTVANHIIRLQRRFFWGKCQGEKGGNLIAWDTIKKPMNLGGLGVGDISIRNAALLFKWWWRFAEDRKSLWKDIVRSNHKVKHIKDFHETKVGIDTSVWGHVMNFEIFSEEIQETARKGFRVKVGDGEHTKFWFDLWTGEIALKSRFPRLFTLSTQKEFYIGEMGNWENGMWRWRFCWRRSLFAWEEDLVEDLCVAVNHVALRENTSDVRIWFFDKSNLFSVSNFVVQVTQNMENKRPSSTHGRLAWKNLAPPRAQLLLWFILQGRLNTKDRLFRMGMTGIEDDKCVFCRDEPETIEHLFFNCRLSSKLWYYCYERWNISFCLPKEPIACFLAWLGTPFINFDKKLWSSMFYVVAWSIWDIRNKATFHGVQPKWEMEKKWIFWRLGVWTRGWCPLFPFSPTDMNDKFSDVRGWERENRIQGGHTL